MSDKFKELMGKLQKNMKNIAILSRKPSFLYLYGNGDQTTFDFDVDDNDEEEDDDDKYVDDFDEWINKHDSCKWFRDMNIFSSIHGYLLDTPEGLKRDRKKKRNKKNKNNKSNEQKLYYKEDTLNELVNYIKLISNKTARFANNLEILNDQINHINKCSELSVEKRIAACNSKLKWFSFNNKEDASIINKFITYESDLKIKQAIITFNEDINVVKKSFDEGLSSLKKQLKCKGLNITTEFKKKLIKNKDMIIKAIQTRERKKLMCEYLYDTASNLAYGSAVALLIGTGSVTPILAYSAFSIIAYQMTPKKLDNIIEENDLTELEFYE